MTTWQSVTTQCDLQALKRFIKTKDNILTDIARFSKTSKDQADALNTLSATTKKIIDLDNINQKGKHKSLQWAAEEAIKQWLTKKASVFLQALKTLPRSITAALANSMKCKAPLEYYRTLSILSQTRRGTIAIRFADRI